MISPKQTHSGTVIFAKLVALVFICLCPVIKAQAYDAVVAKVNGRAITEADMRLAATEIGEDLLSYPPETRRRVVIEFLIQNELFADAAAKKNVATSSVFKERQHYWDRRNMRDAYFETEIRNRITDAQIRQYYEQQIKNFPDGLKMRVSQIVLKSKDKAKTVFELIVHDGNFVDLARQYSVDKYSASKGGDLGYIGSGHLAPQLAKIAASLPIGEASEPIETSSGWYILKVRDMRKTKVPAFEDVKGNITTQLLHDRARALLEVLRGAAQIEYLDPSLIKQ